MWLHVLYVHGQKPDIQLYNTTVGETESAKNRWLMFV